MNILAFDIAGSSTGWAYGNENKLIDYGKYISNLNKDRGERLFEFATWIESILRKYEPDVVLVEKPFLGRNSNVLANLSKFVSVAELKTFEILNINIQDEWFVDPRGIKRILKVNRPKGKKTGKARHDDNKRLMVNKINKLYGLRLKYSQNKNKKYNDDDIADSIAVYTAWLRMRTNENK